MRGNRLDQAGATRENRGVGVRGGALTSIDPRCNAGGIAELTAEVDILEPQRPFGLQGNGTPSGSFGTILADPPWRFLNRTGKVAPEHRRLSRYDTMTTHEIGALPVANVAAERSHLYLWVPNALLAEGLRVMEAWGYTYKANLVWHKVRKDGGSDGRGVGFYFRNVTELVLFGVRGSLRTRDAGRRQVNLLATRKREHSRKPDELYAVIEACSPGPYLELFARYPQPGWCVWGHEAAPEIVPRGQRHRGYAGGVTLPVLEQLPLAR